MLSLILANALFILLAGGTRFGPDAVLAGAPPALWLPLLAVLAAGLALALRREIAGGRAPWQCRTRLLLWLVFPGAAALNWSIGSREQVAGSDLPALALLLGLVVAVLARRWPEWGGREFTRRGWLQSARWVLLPTLAVVVAGALGGEGLRDSGVALATYPLFAVLQLAAVLILPWTQWQRDGVSPAGSVAGSTILFALVHWPNPFATLATALGMLVWALAWRNGSALLPLALSMGITATVVTQTLPDNLTGHMRVGASYALSERADARSGELDRQTGRILADAGWDPAEGLDQWLLRVVPPATGDEISPALARGLADQLEQMHRAQTVRWFFDSAEFRRRHRAGAPLLAAEIGFFHSPFVPFLEAHAPYAELVAAGASLDQRSFVELVYARLLGRAPVESEYRHWPPPLAPEMRAAFVRRLLKVSASGDALRRWNEPDPDELLREREATAP